MSVLKAVGRLDVVIETMAQSCLAAYPTGGFSQCLAKHYSFTARRLCNSDSPAKAPLPTSGPVQSFLHLIEHRIPQPFLDGRFPPSAASLCDLDLLGERPCLHLAVQRRPGKPGAIEHGIEPQDPVGCMGSHGHCLHPVM